MEIKERTKISIPELCKILKLGESVLRTHLSRFEKYKIPCSRPALYYYNYAFLLELQSFYQERYNSVSKKYEIYKDTVKRLEKIINLWKKKLELTSVSSENYEFNK